LRKAENLANVSGALLLGTSSWIAPCASGQCLRRQRFRSSSSMFAIAARR
jgi:hypothetical protein